MNFNYLIYRLFETKWKKKIFDEAINERSKNCESVFLCDKHKSQLKSSITKYRLGNVE